VLFSRTFRCWTTTSRPTRAPDIDGTDLEGEPLRLSDSRGTVVVLAFSGEWCGSCRLEYPYQRLMQDVLRLAIES
jgi:peroxiredoxin